MDAKGRSSCFEARRVLEAVEELLGISVATISAQFVDDNVVSCSPTMIDFRADGSLTPLPLPDGPLPGRVVVVDERESPIGEILIWMRDGVLAGMEQAWYTDSPPVSWPKETSLRLVGGT